MTDKQKIAFADLIAELLKTQLKAVNDGTIESIVGGPKRKAIGYVYGYVDATLRTEGWDMADSETGVPITFHVIRRLWPGKEEEYTTFLAEHLSDPIVAAGIMHGGQQRIDSIKSDNSASGPTGLARYILEET